LLAKVLKISVFFSLPLSPSFRNLQTSNLHHFDSECC